MNLAFPPTRCCIRRFVLLCVLWLLGSETALTVVSAQALPAAKPEEVGLFSKGLEAIDSAVHQAIQEGKMPGCVIGVSRFGKVAYLCAFGNRKLPPMAEKMTTDTVFDLASITKPLATGTSIMILLEQGRLSLQDKVATHLPEFGRHGKEAITIQDMLVHQSGLTPDNALADYLDGHEIAWEKICDLHLIGPVGQQFKYSDVNFIVLAILVERLSGESIDQFASKQIFAPLGMDETGYRPSAELSKRAAVTQQRDGEWMRGDVHDPRAWALDGVAGHAGVFSTATDLLIFGEMMLRNGSLARGSGEVEILKPETVRQMTDAYPVSNGVRSLGWDKQSVYSSNRGSKLSKSAFGHGGFTGTVLWMDPELQLTFVFLSNRVHPDGKGNVNRLAGDLLDIVVDSLEPYPPTAGAGNGTTAAQEGDPQ